MIAFFFSIWHVIRKNLTSVDALFPGIATFVFQIFPKKKASTMEKNIPHFLRISGYVPGNKRREFEQTIKFVFNQLPVDCIEHSLSADVFVEGHYHFFSVWLKDSAMKSFMSSMEFQLLSGAYYTLGDDDEKLVHGPVADIQVFRVSNIN